MPVTKGADMSEQRPNFVFVMTDTRATNVLGCYGSPRWAAAGTRVGGLVSHIDLLPTVLSLADAPVPPALEGSSLLPQLRGERGDPDRAVFVAFNRFAAQGEGRGGFTPMRAIVKGSHKLNVSLRDTDERYDLATDPAECRNRIDVPALADVRDTLHDELLDWMHAHRDPFRAPDWEQRPWRGAPLRLAFGDGWTGTRRSRDDGGAPPFTQENVGTLGRS